MLSPRLTPGASITPIDDGWRFQIPAGPAGSYRLAQLDDYASLPRGRFPFNAPATLSLRCRISEALLPGTWGFGFWNDPFGLSFGLGGTAWRLPVLPNAAWFFHGSPENYLSLRADKPSSGFLAASLSSPKIPSVLLAAGLVVTPLLFSKMLAKWLRAAASRIVAEDSTGLDVDPTEWHEYTLRWESNRVEFSVNGQPVFKTVTSPKGPLGLVLWIDNQFAAFTPVGKISAGTLENPVPAWMEISALKLS